MSSALHRPILFLDVDRTLFDTERFYHWLGTDRHAQVLALLSGKRAHPDYAEFLFPETRAFLMEQRKHFRLVLLSYSVNPNLQRRKIRESGLAALVDDVLIVSGKKSDAATAYLARFAPSAWTHVFVDDDVTHVQDMRAAHPEFRVIRMGTQEMADPEVEVVADLAELEKCLDPRTR